MDGENAQDFVTRQYAGLIAGGMDEASARTRLGEVLGEAALALLGGTRTAANARAGADASDAARLMDTVTRLGGNAAAAHAAFIHATGEARLLALDWWRPIRTFLLYILFLLALALAIAITFAIHILPVFRNLGQAMAMQGGGAWWANNDVRLFVPLVIIALLFALLATRWYRMRLRMARLQPFTALARWPLLYGRAGVQYHALLCLEQAAALKAGGVADASILQDAARLAHWPQGRPLGVADNALGAKLEQAQRLGTFDAELEWQRRLCWSTVQSRLEMSRDRLTLASRVIFYILIGYMVALLYIPIFSIANLFGVHA